MGARGPKPTPTAVLSVRGSWRADRRTDEPEFPPGAPECPSYIIGEALVEWERVVPILMASRVLTEGDLSALVSYCRFWGEYLKFQTRCDKLLEKTKGPFAHYPQEYALRNSAYDRMSKAAALLGLSPADRTRVKAAAPEKLKKEGKGQYFDEGAA